MHPDLVRLAASAAEAPLASMIADLVRQNIAGNRRKTRSLLALHLHVTLVAIDIGSAATLLFAGAKGLIVTDGESVPRDGQPSVTIRADSATILDLARLSLLGRTGIPVLWDEVGTMIFLRLIRGEIRIIPAGRHLGRIMRMLQVMSVA